MYLDIKKIRFNEKLSQQYVADKAKINRSYLSKLERNVPGAVKGVRLGTLEEIAKALNVSINKIIKD